MVEKQILWSVSGFGVEVTRDLLRGRAEHNENFLIEDAEDVVV